MALDNNDLLVVSKNSDGSLAKVKVETLLAGTGSIEEAPIDGKEYARKDGAWVEIAAGATQKLSFAFLDKTTIEKDSTDLVNCITVFTVDIPTSFTYQWYEYDSSSETPAEATSIFLAFNSYIRANSSSLTKDRVGCEVTATFEDGSTLVVEPTSWCEVFTPLGGGEFPSP